MLVLCPMIWAFSSKEGASAKTPAAVAKLVQSCKYVFMDAERKIALLENTVHMHCA